jgi:hypothetical protein
MADSSLELPLVFPAAPARALHATLAAELIAFRDFDTETRRLINYALEHGVVPTGWQRGWLYPLQKDSAKGADLKNLRPITLLETPLKLLTMHLNDGIHDAWDAQPALSPMQGGFQRGVGTGQIPLARDGHTERIRRTG